MVSFPPVASSSTSSATTSASSLSKMKLKTAKEPKWVSTRDAIVQNGLGRVGSLF